jgi:hypothetical protein
MATTADTLVDARVAQLERLVAQQGRAIAALTARVESLVPLDDAAWLAIVARSTSGACFTAKELHDHARVDPELRRALASMDARATGARLKWLARHPVDGVHVEMVDRCNVGCIWRVSHRDPSVS